MLAQESRSDPECQNHLADSFNNVGTVQIGTGRSREAQAAFEEALRIREQLVAEHPDAIKYSPVPEDSTQDFLIKRKSSDCGPTMDDSEPLTLPQLIQFGLAKLIQFFTVAALWSEVKPWP